MKRIHNAFLFALLLVSCARLATAVPPGTLAQDSPGSETPTPSLSQAPTVKPSDTPTPVYLNFKGLDSGQYLLVWTEELNESYLYVVSKDNRVVKKLPLHPYLEFVPDLGTEILTANFSTSNDGTQFLIMRPDPNNSYSLDVSTGEWTVLALYRKCMDASWSPDNRFIALACSVSKIDEEIFIFDKVSGSIFQATHCQDEQRTCLSPAWSTDGHWLAYYESDRRSGTYPNGVIVFSTNCFKSSACPNEQIGPIQAESNPIWSPKNLLMMCGSGMINYSVVENGAVTQTSANLLPYLAHDPCVTIKLSPDGNYLAYTVSDVPGVYLYSRSSDNAKLLLESQDWAILVGWISIP
jgi:hypothetical protein